MINLSEFKLVTNPGPERSLHGEMKRHTELFLRGPIPMAWLHRAYQVPRKDGLAVGVLIYHVAGLRKSDKRLVITARRAEEVLGVGKKAFHRGLRDLEQAGLIRVERAKGRAAIVDIIRRPGKGERR